MKRAIFVLVLLGALGVVLAILGVSSYSVTTQGQIVTHFHDVVSRVVAGLWGAFLLLLAFGIYRRSMLAYWGGWFVLVASCAWFLYVAIPVVLASQPRPSVWLLIAFVAAVVVGAVLVFAYWGSWWHRQLGHFQRNAG
ncbi:MAG TPA: hypothetical protein VN693_08905 [Rhodanobacteraceae bacterium]|nr:hypothetical protein [Rhodanobacteraceae bacterium]